QDPPRRGAGLLPQLPAGRAVRGADPRDTRAGRADGRPGARRVLPRGGVPAGRVRHVGGAGRPLDGSAARCGGLRGGRHGRGPVAPTQREPGGPARLISCTSPRSVTRAHEYDVAIVGGGPAGLAAAFWLARYRRRVCVLDAGGARNERTWAVHGSPGLPDLPPAELRRRLREQAEAAGAEVVAARVTRIEGRKGAFDVHASAAPALRARRVLLAYGVRDLLPAVPGLEEALGTAIYHCPDCDGPSMMGCRVAVIGWTRRAAKLALFLRTWAGRLELLAHGHPPELDRTTLDILARYHVALRPERIVRLVPAGGRTVSLHLENGDVLGVEG